MENNNSGFEQMEVKSNKKSSALKGILVLLILVIILGAGYFVYNTIFASAKVQYLKLEQKELGSVSKFISENIEKINVDRIVETNTDMDVEVLSDGDKSIKFNGKLNTQVNLKEDKIHNIFNLNYKGDELGSIELIQNDKKISLLAKDFYQKYISLETDKLDNLKKIADIDLGVKRLVLSSEIYPLLNIPQKDIDYIVKKYGEIVVKNIDEKYITLEKDVEIDIEGKKYKTNKFVIDMKGMENSFVAILKELKNDDKALKIILGSVGEIINIYEEAGYFDASFKSMEDTLKQYEEQEKEGVLGEYAKEYQQQLKKEMTEQKEFLAAFKDTESLKTYIQKLIDNSTSEEIEGEEVSTMTVYAYNNKIIKREFKDQDGVVVSFYNYDKEDGLNVKMIQTNMPNMNTNEQQEIVLKYECVAKENNQSTYKLIYTADDEEQLNVDLVIGKDNFKLNSTLPFGYLSNNKLKLNINTEIKDINSIELPEITEGKEVNLSTVSQKNFEKLFEDILNGVNKYFEEKSKVLEKMEKDMN